MNILDKTRLLQSTILGGLLVGLSIPAFAQDTIPTEVEQVADTFEDDDIDTIVVTGSRIKRDNFSSISPLQVITADTIIDSGLTSTADIIKSQTVINGVQLDTNFNSSFVTDGGPGASNVSLRGLGADRTLVLVNGRRFAPAGVEGAPSLPDLNLIPSSLVQRVDTLLDGASSIYGSDAIAGVVNVILRDEFDGFRVDGSFTEPFETGGETRRISALMGSTGDKGKFIAAVEYRVQDELNFDQRDFQLAANGQYCSLDIEINSGTGEEFRNCGGAIGSAEFRLFVSPFGQGDEFGDTGFFDVLNSRDPNFRSGTLEAKDDLLNEQEALTAYVSADRDIELLGVDQTVFFETSFSNVQTNVRQGFHGQLFPNVPADNPFNFLGTAFGADAVPVVFSPIKRSDINVDVTQYRMTAGLKGDLNFLDNWSHETFGSYSRSVGDSVRPVVLEDRLLLSQTTAVRAADGTVSCGLDVPPRFGFFTIATCIPVNFFAPSLYNGANPQFATQAEHDYLRGERSVTTKVDQLVLSTVFTGPVYELPAGEIQAAFGAEWREDGLDSGTDTIASTGGAAGFFADQPSIGTVSQYEVFGELDIPLVSGKQMAEELTVNLSGRFVNNKFYDSEFVYAAKGIYRPTDFLSFKASYGTSYRSPGARELFLGGQTSFGSSNSDPCIVPIAARRDDDGDPATTPVYDPSEDQRRDVVLNNCRAEGVDPLALGLAGTSSIEFFRAGNRRLDPETSTALSLGATFEQPFTDAFDLIASVNYYEIDVDDAPSIPGGATILSTCYNSTDFPNDPFCQRRERNPLTGFLTRVDITPFNLANFGAKGYDFNLRGAFDFDAGGRTFEVTSDTVVTHQFERISRDLPEAPLSNASGDYGFPKWRGNSNMRVATGDLSFFWGVRFIGSQDDIDRQTGEVIERAADGRLAATGGRTGSDTVVTKLDSYFRHDLSVRYTAGDEWSFVLGLNNVFDKAPPTLDQDVGASLIGNVPAGVGYDVRGRSMFMTASKTF